MRSKSLYVCCALMLLAAVVPPVSAEHHEASLAAYASNLEFVGGRAVQLARAIPEDNYGWRPMEGVRSVSEAVMHMTSANYFFAGRMGTEVPEGIDMSTMEKVTAKEECVAALEKSIEHLKKAYGAVEDPSAKIDIFGREGTVEGMMLIAIGHVHEHFGQLIAYARSNQVVPPWSQSDGG